MSKVPSVTNECQPNERNGEEECCRFRDRGTGGFLPGNYSLRDVEQSQTGQTEMIWTQAVGSKCFYDSRTKRGLEVAGGRPGGRAEGRSGEVANEHWEKVAVRGEDGAERLR